MEQLTQTQQTLNELRLHVNDSLILPMVTPLFDTLTNQSFNNPHRVSEHKGDAQLFWEVKEAQTNNFERICLTLSRATLSLTIALEHNHGNPSKNAPVIPISTGEMPGRSTMVIDAHSHILFESNRSNGVLLGTHYDNEATARFTPVLHHTLGVISLNNYNQGSQQEVS